jgi:hypothetical protein
MKKVLLAVAVVAFLASCKKDYTCTCVDTSGVEPLLPTTTQNFSGLSNTEADVQESACTFANGGFSDYTCTWAQD